MGPANAVALLSKGESESPDSGDLNGTATRAILSSNIPSDFVVVFEWHTQPINIVRFYLNSIIAITEEAAFPFFGSSQGFYAEKFELVVLPSESQFPHLQHNHIIWAVEIVARALYRNRSYKELTGHIILAVNDRRVDLGGILIKNPTETPPEAYTTENTKALDPTLVEGLPSAALRGDTPTSGLPIRINDTSEPSLGSASNTLSTDSQPLTTFTNPSTTYMLSIPPSSAGMKLDLKYLPNGVRLRSVDIFIAVIRFGASLAPTDAATKFESQDYLDSEAGILIKVKVSTEQPPTITYLDCVKAAYVVAIEMATVKIPGQRLPGKYAEAKGVFFKREGTGPMVEFGEIEVLNYVPAAAEVS